MDRVVIIGNLGSGKTYLAQRLGSCLALDVIHLDELLWDPDGLDLHHPAGKQNTAIAGLARSRFWIVEGVVGELAHEFFRYADSLIWLDMDWATCMAGLRTRHPEEIRGSAEGGREEKLRKIRKWASEYWQRFDHRSYRGHQHLFSQFKGRKIRLTSSRAIESFLESIPPVKIWG